LIPSTIASLAASIYG
jgi:hypothetical protein